MIEVIKYIGRDKDSPGYSEAPFDSIKQAEKVAELESRKFPKALFTVEENNAVVTYWWQGRKRSAREIRIRRERLQW